MTNNTPDYEDNLYFPEPQKNNTGKTAKQNYIYRDDG